jgi:predicted RNA-binding Zn ribbon-like protein
MACYGDSYTFLYVVNIRSSQETRLWASMACYGDSYTFLYVVSIRSSQETRLWVSMASYGDSYTFYMWLVFVAHRKHAYGSP